MSGPQGSESMLPIAPICSARGCRAESSWVLAWNNPKLHTPDRRKTWTACGTHRKSLAEFLQARGFLRETQPVSLLGTAGNASGDDSAADR